MMCLKGAQSLLTWAHSVNKLKPKSFQFNATIAGEDSKINFQYERIADWAAASTNMEIGAEQQQETANTGTNWGPADTNCW